MIKSKRLKKRNIRRNFKRHCLELSLKLADIGFDLHWSRMKGEPRRVSTKFSIWKQGESATPIVKDLSIDEVKDYIDRLSGLKVFV